MLRWATGLVGSQDLTPGAFLNAFSPVNRDNPGFFGLGTNSRILLSSQVGGILACRRLKTDPS